MNRVVAPGSLSGSFRAPASKSHAHRLLICAALGTAPVTVLCDTFSDDILATIDCLTAMGAQITHEESRISVTPVFASRKLVELCKLPCRESGSTLRFLLPVLGALGLSGVFQMEGRLPERPLHPLGIGHRAGDNQIVLHRHSSSLPILWSGGADVRKGRARGTSFFQGSRSSSATAWAAMPELSPVKPRCSSVVAFTFTRSASVPRAAERFASISGR